MASATARIGALLALLAAGTDALRLPLAALGHASGASSAAPPVAVCRRAVLALPGAAAAAGLLLGGAASPAMASGGATAGKTTSIPRAKLRYYARITGAVAAFERLSDALSAGSMGELKAFFAKDGPYDELQGAGFLLAVAFKIDSKIPPDKVPTVRMHKKLMAEFEKLKGVKKPADAAKALASTRAALAEYLDGVELPPLGDARYDEDVAV